MIWERRVAGVSVPQEKNKYARGEPTGCSRYSQTRTPMWHGALVSSSLGRRVNEDISSPSSLDEIRPAICGSVGLEAELATLMDDAHDRPDLE